MSYIHNLCLREQNHHLKMIKKIISYFGLLLAYVIYDRLVKQYPEFPVNMAIFFFVSGYGFVLYRIFIDTKETKNKVYRTILLILSLPFALRVGLNLSAINTDYEIYNKFTSNYTIDIITWGALLIVFSIALIWINSKFHLK